MASTVCLWSHCFIYNESILERAAGSDGGLSDSGGTLSDSGASLVSIAISPASASLQLYANVGLHATGLFSDGTHQDVSDQCNWTTSAPQTVSISQTGIATGLIAGSSTITATIRGMTSQALITVASIPPNAITINASTATLGLTSTFQFKAQATYPNGSSADVTSSSVWTSSATSILSIAASGIATGVGLGNSTVTATLNSSGTVLTSAPVGVTVNNPVTKITISPTSAALTLASGSNSVNLQLTGTYANGTQGALSGNLTNVVWSTSQPSVLSVGTNLDGSGTANAQSAGSSTVSATWSGQTPAITSSPITVTVTNPVVSIAISPSSVSPMAYGATLQFTLQGTLSSGASGGAMPGTITWTSSDSTTVTVNSSGVATDVGSTGNTVNLSAVLVGSTLTAAPVIVPTTAYVISALNPPSVNVNEGTTATFNVVVTNTMNGQPGQPGPGQITWTSINPSVAYFSSSLSSVVTGGKQINASTPITACLTGTTMCQSANVINGAAASK